MKSANNSPIAINISGVKKMYRLGQIGGGTLQADLQSWWARIRGKEDPNTIIGDDQRSNGETFMALNGVNLTIYQGEAVGIIGSNGAGKSTLLKLLSKVTAPTEGEIDIYGRIASMLEVGTGFNGELTGRENVYMNGAILGMTKSEIDAKMDQIIEFSEVGEFIDTPVKRYSSGMFVKLAFSVAAHLDSEIMIMDEVLAVGDMAFQKKCLTKMREAAKQDGRTVLYVSHNMNTIRQLCDRCVVLDKGKVVYDGDTESAIKVYMGTKSDNPYRTEYDFSNTERNLHFGNLAKIGKCVFLNKQKTVYEVGEKIQYALTINSTISIENACILTHIRNVGYEKIGMSCSSLFSLVPGTHKIVVEVDTDYFTNDVYCLNFEIVEVGNTKNTYSYDNPGAKIMVEFIGKNAHTVSWNKSYWGNIAFPDTKVVSCEKTN